MADTSDPITVPSTEAETKTSSIEEKEDASEAKPDTSPVIEPGPSSVESVSKPVVTTASGIEMGDLEGKEEDSSEEKVGPGPILESGPSSVESVLKPVVEEFTEGAKSLVTSCVDRVEKGLVDQLARVSEPMSFKLPTSDQKVGESSSEPAKPESVEKEEGGLEENQRSINTQPFVASTRASWINCCGLLDILRPSDR